MLKFAIGLFSGVALGVISMMLLPASEPDAQSASPPATTEPDETAAEAVADAESVAPVTPAYMVVLGTVTDREAFMEGYVSKLAPIYEKYNGHYISLGGSHEVLEGETGFESHVISQWPGGMEDARAFWASPEYAPLKQARIDNNWGTFDVFLIGGLPQPTGE